MQGAKTAACSIMPSAKLVLFSPELPIFVIEVTNVLFRESHIFRRQENTAVGGSFAGGVLPRSLNSTFYNPEKQRKNLCNEKIYTDAGRQDEIMF